MASRATSRPRRTPRANATKLRVFARAAARRAATRRPTSSTTSTSSSSARYGAREAFEGGLRVYTTLDMRMQHDAISGAQGHACRPGRPARSCRSTRPTASSAPWRPAPTGSTTKFNLAWQAHRQLGSAMKPFALIGGRRAGRQPGDHLLQLAAAAHLPGPGRGAALLGRRHLLEHLRRAHQPGAGHLAVRQHVFAQLALDLGPRQDRRAWPTRWASRARSQPIPRSCWAPRSSTPLEMADAYATMADEGVHHAPQAIEKVVFPERPRRPAPRSAASA